MGDYGAEFKNVGELITTGQPVSALLGSLIADGAAVLYFPPGAYDITSPDGTIPFSLVIPEGTELRFAPNARLNPAQGVTLVIRGSIRAGRQQIFGVSRRDASPEGPYPHLPNAARLRVFRTASEFTRLLGPYLERQTAPDGVVRIESEEIDEIYPEWWGAVFNEPDTQIDSSDALQACFDAACRDRVRDGRRLPCLPVAMSGPYITLRKLRVEPPPGQDGTLWLRGVDVVSHAGAGAVSVQRSSLGVLAAVGLTDQACAIEVLPRATLQVEGVSFNSVWANTEAVPEVANTIQVLRDGSDRLRFFVFDRCGFGGGRDTAFVLVEGTYDARGVRVSSDVAGDTVRAVFRQCVFNATRADLPSGHAARVRRLLQLDLREEDAVTLDGCFLRGDGFKMPPQNPLVPGRTMDFEAGVHVRGGSVFVRGCTFHFADGPRPSHEEPAIGAFDVPDGQDLWLDSGPERAVSTQLTVLQCETQSWWFLGGVPVRRGLGRASTVLLGLSGGNVNWGDNASKPILLALRRSQGISADSVAQNESSDPPVVAWPGGDVPLVMVGCMVKRYVTIGPETEYDVYNVGSAFRLPYPAMQGVPCLLPARFIPRPPAYRPVIAVDPAQELPVAALPLLEESGRP